MTNKDNIIQFKKEILALIAERQKVNEYIEVKYLDSAFNVQSLFVDDVFYVKGLHILERYLDIIKNKIKFRDILSNWIHVMEKNSDKFEPYIIHGMMVIAGALNLYIITGKKPSMCM